MGKMLESLWESGKYPFWPTSLWVKEELNVDGEPGGFKALSKFTKIPFLIFFFFKKQNTSIFF